MTKLNYISLAAIVVLSVIILLSERFYPAVAERRLFSEPNESVKALKDGWALDRGRKERLLPWTPASKHAGASGFSLFRDGTHADHVRLEMDLVRFAATGDVGNLVKHDAIAIEEAARALISDRTTEGVRLLVRKYGNFPSDMVPRAEDEMTDFLVRWAGALGGASPDSETAPPLGPVRIAGVSFGASDRASPPPDPMGDRLPSGHRRIYAHFERTANSIPIDCIYAIWRHAGTGDVLHQRCETVSPSVTVNHVWLQLDARWPHGDYTVDLLNPADDFNLLTKAKFTLTHDNHDRPEVLSP